MVKTRVRTQPNRRQGLSILLLTGAFALAATGAHAQGAGRSGHGHDRAESRADQDDRQGRPWRIVGSWFATTTTGLRQLITFHADGTVLRSVPGEVSGDSTRPPHTAAHGVWRYLGEGRFGVTLWDIFYDFNTGQLLHYMKLRLDVTMDDSGDAAAARAVLQVIDTQGGVVSSRAGASNLVRIPFEPLE